MCLVVKYYKNGNTIKNTINFFGISKSSLFNWLKLDKNNLLSEKKKYKKVKLKINNEIINYIIKYVIKRISFNYKFLLKNIKRKFKIKVSKTTIYNVLKKNNITLKKINKKNIPKNKKRLRKQIKEFNKNIKKVLIKDIISIDEIHFDTTIKAFNGWEYKGKKICVNINPVKKRYTVICAISNKNIVHYKIIKNSANKIDFLEFIKYISIKHKNKYFLLDNAQIHHAKNIKEYINTTTNKLIYNIPYNPETNPIKMYFSKLKKLVIGLFIIILLLFLI